MNAQNVRTQIRKYKLFVGYWLKAYSIKHRSYYTRYV